jgi:hypothetical protein
MKEENWFTVVITIYIGETNKNETEEVTESEEKKRVLSRGEYAHICAQHIFICYNNLLITTMRSCVPDFLGSPLNAGA